MIFRNAAVLSLALGVAGPTLGQERPTSPYREPTTGICFPEKLGAFRQVGVREYEDPTMKVRARYRAPGPAKADVYVYTLGLKGIGTGVRSPKVKAHFEAVKGAILKCTAYKGVVQQAEGQWTIKTAKRELSALYARFEYTERSGPCVSCVLVTAYKGNFLKIRFVFQKREQGQAEETSKGFLTALGAHME